MPAFVYTPRNYLHFDAPVNKEFAQQLATTPALVARHPFFPFIHYEVVSLKIRKSSEGGVEAVKPKVRPIAYAAHKDSHIFGHYATIVGERYESALHEHGLNQSVIAFRRHPGKSNVHFADEAFEHIKRTGNCAVLAADIRDFFPSLKHEHIKSSMCRLLKVNRLPDDIFSVFKAVTQFAQVERREIYKVLGLDEANPRADGRRRLCSAQQFRDLVRANGLCKVNLAGKGIPQGSPISALLANAYMLDFDMATQAFTAKHGGMYRRYCDDLLVVLPTPQLRTELVSLIRANISALGLTLHPTKTEEIDFSIHQGRLVSSKVLGYLGFTFDGVHKRIRSASIARYYKKARAGVKRTRAVRYQICKASGNWTPMRRRKLHILYTYLGRHNFISYAIKAATIMKDDGIKRQVKAHWKRLQADIKREAPDKEDGITPLPHPK